MEKQELRVGSKVNLNGADYSIKSIEWNGANQEYYVRVNEDFRGLKLSHLLPIPITEELLLKAGFELQYFGTIKTDAYKNKIVTIHCIGGNTGEFQVAIFNKIFPIYIQYIHQLQNLIYSLTGSELTFKQ